MTIENVRMDITTNYGLITGIYFKKLLKSIIKIAGLDKRQITVLDFGAGHGYLKKIIQNPKCKVVNYDIREDLSEVKTWQEVEFDLLVSNEVFYCLKEEELESLMRELKEKRPGLELVVGISRQSILNNIGKHLLGESDAHDATQTSPQRENEILLKHCKIISKKNVWFLADVLHLKFRE